MKSQKLQALKALGDSLHALTFVPDFVTIEELGRGDYTPWVVLHTDRKAVSKARIEKLFREFAKGCAGEPSGESAEWFAEFLQDKGYIVPNVHEDGVAEINGFCKLERLPGNQ